jgi:hypothetical protein
MSITFSCEHCHKEIKAPQAAAGKRGKCPYCGQTSYVPDPDEQEEIPLAPVDDEEEQRRQAEIERLRQADRVLLEADAEAGPAVERDNVQPEDLYHHVVNYCLDMAESKLERAQTHAENLKPHGYTGLQAVDDFLTGKALEPALDEIPGRLRQGFLEQLRKQLR